MKTFKLVASEEILPLDYPVFPDYFYICDNIVRRSDVQGDVTTLINNLASQGIHVKEVRRFSFCHEGIEIGDRVEKNPLTLLIK